MAIAMFLSKPETYLIVVMFLLFSDLIRTEVFVICILFIVWGISVFIFNTRKLMNPYNYKRLRDDTVQAGISKDRIKVWDKMIGYKED